MSEQDEKKCREDEKNRKILKKDVERFEIEKREFNISRTNFIIFLLKEGFSIEKISKMSKVPVEKIKMMIL